MCVQPRILYYAWQVEVMINNFLKHGINPSDIEILVAWNPNDETSRPDYVEAWDKLTAQYNTVKFFYYQDTRQQPIHYISSVRPNILKQHFAAFPELESEVIFYHDCDVVFTRKPDFEKFVEDDTWYLSDTNSYINYDYIISKGQDVYDKMCEIVGMDQEIPKQNNQDSGGAQYILKNVNAKYWEKVERDSEQLFFQISQLNAQKKFADPTHHELQIWCADMWAVLWNAWLSGHKTKVVPEMDFCWATDHKSRWDKAPIFHNAGVVGFGQKLFYKAVYMSSVPYGVIEDLDEESASYKYYLEIQETATKSCLR